MQPCYRNGGCGPYESYSCTECPASKPEYQHRQMKNETPSPRVKLWNLVSRYKQDAEMLKTETNPMCQKLLKRRLERHTEDIMEYLMNSGVVEQLERFSI